MKLHRQNSQFISKLNCFCKFDTFHHLIIKIKRFHIKFYDDDNSRLKAQNVIKILKLVKSFGFNDDDFKA